MEYLIPILIFAALAIFAGAVLTFLSFKFPSETTDDVNAVRDALPGLNCGSCGFAGCDEYAKKCVSDKLAPNLCTPGGNEAAAKIAKITGVPFDEVKSVKAHVICRGDYNATHDKYDYRGALSCAASSLFYGGRSSCRDGCLGFGDCAEVCPSDAIKVRNGVAVVDREKCTGCLMCAKVCPKKLIVPIAEDQPMIVSCISKANGKETRLTCQHGCIGCKLCVRNCPKGAITVTDFHAAIDPALCDGCAKCAENCPVGCITALNGKIIVDPESLLL